MVTDHALLRYLERVMGLDMEACRDHIVTPEIRDAVRIGAASIYQNGFTYIIEEGAIVTVLEGRAHNTKRRREND